MIDQTHQDLFHAKVDVLSPDECWEWQGARDRHGYGRICWRSGTGHSGMNARAHRIAFLIANEEIPEGQVVMHTCDNPSCCNPDHLKLGTLSDNTKDMYDKGRRVPKRGESSPTAKLTLEKVRAIRDMAALGTAHTALSRMYHVSPTQIRRIVRGERW